MRQIKVLFSLATFVAVFVTINCYSEDIEYWSWSYHNYPNLTSPREAKFCTGPLRNPPSSICDPDQVLSKHESKFCNFKISIFKKIISKFKDWTN